MNSRSLRIPPFGINYDVTDFFSILKVIKLVSSETSAHGERYGEAVNRVSHSRRSQNLVENSAVQRLYRYMFDEFSKAKV